MDRAKRPVQSSTAWYGVEEFEDRRSGPAAISVLDGRTPCPARFNKLSQLPCLLRTWASPNAAPDPFYSSPVSDCSEPHEFQDADIPSH
jgi:hypothetical protein